MATVRVDEREQLGDALGRVGAPRPVIVLIGGAGKLTGDEDALERLVREGVVAPARELGAAIVDGGTDAGIMALAGRARRESGEDVPLIGVAPRMKVAPDGGTELEPNHSLVLLVPGDEWGAESPWLVATAKALSGGRPIAAVLIEGGPIALSEAMEAAAQGWPVIAVAGSGRSADLLAGNGAAGVRVVNFAAGPSALAAALRDVLRERGEPTAPVDLRAPSSADLPALYLAASEAAKRGQTIHRRLSLAEIGLTTVGLAIVLTAVFVQPLLNVPPAIGSTTTITISAISFILALLLKFISRSSGFDADWYNGRALAETVKGLAWRYMMRATPYAQADSDRRFTADLAALLSRGARFRQATDRLPARPQQISAHMRAARELGTIERRDYYVQNRLLDQADWYQRRSGASGRKGSRWFWLSVLFQVAAAISAIAALVAGGELLPKLITFLGSIALAIAAWSQLNRYDELSKAYGVAFQELSLIAAVADNAVDEATVNALVRDGEEAIGREHRLWIAKRTESAAGPTDVDDSGDGTDSGGEAGE